MTIALEMQLAGSSGAWTDLWADVRMDTPVNVSYGITGIGPMDHMAETGTMSFALDNSQANSAKKLGYYAPGSACARGGFDIGIRARLSVTYSGSTFYKFLGTLQEATPEAGRLYSRSTHCVVTDWMDEAANHQLKLIGMQTDQTTGQLVSTVVSNMVRLPAASTINPGQDNIKFAGDNWQDESTTAYEALSDIVMSEWGYLYVKGDQTTGGVLQFDDRLTRIRNTTITAVLTDENLVGMGVSRVRQNVLNRFNVQTHPRSSDLSPATCVLYMLDNPIPIGAGATASIVGQYTDPLGFTDRCGGGSMISPLANVDWTFNTQETVVSTTSGCDPRVHSRKLIAASLLGGVDIASALTVSASFGANEATYAITNTCPTKNGFLTQLIARGRGLYDYVPMTYLSESASSQAAYGLHTATIDMPLQTDNNVAKDIGDYLLSWYKDPQYVIDSVEFYGEESGSSFAAGIGTMIVGYTFVVGWSGITNLNAGLHIEPGSRIIVSEQATGIGRECFVNGYSMEITPGAPLGETALIKFTLAVYPADTTDYWILGTSVLDTETILGW